MQKTIRNESVEIYAEIFGSFEHVPILLIAGAMARQFFGKHISASLWLPVDIMQ